jgi:hypothetical protein
VRRIVDCQPGRQQRPKQWQQIAIEDVPSLVFRNKPNIDNAVAEVCCVGADGHQNAFFFPPVPGKALVR